MTPIFCQLVALLHVLWRVQVEIQTVCHTEYYFYSKILFKYFVHIVRSVFSEKSREFMITSSSTCWHMLIQILLLPSIYCPGLLQNLSGITKCNNSLLQNVTFITKWDNSFL